MLGLDIKSRFFDEGKFDIMLTLYHFGDSLCSIKVRLCLSEKGVEYDAKFIDLMKFENLEPDYLALNPNGVLPTIVHDGKPVIESTVINEYIDEAFAGPSLRPDNAHERARMRVWTKLQDDVVHPAIQKPTFNLLVKPILAGMSDQELEEFTGRHPHEANRNLFRNAARGPVDQVAIDAAKERFVFVFGRMEQALEQAGWLAGESYSLADIAIAPAIDRLTACGLYGLFEKFPKVLDWAERVKSREAFQRAVPSDEMRLKNFAA